MKNEDSIGLKRLCKGRNFVPNVQDNLTMKKTSQHAKNTRKQKSNALKRLAHKRRRMAPQSEVPKRMPVAAWCLEVTCTCAKHMSLGVGRTKTCKKSLFVTFSPMEAHDFSLS